MSRKDYLRTLLARFCGLPAVAARRPSPADRRLASQWFDEGISLDLLEAAFLLATTRRAIRSPDLPPLSPIRSLAYFLPVLEELRLSPPDAGYLAYLRSRRPEDRISTHSGDR